MHEDSMASITKDNRIHCFDDDDDDESATYVFIDKTRCNGSIAYLTKDMISLSW